MPTDNSTKLLLNSIYGICSSDGEWLKRYLAKRKELQDAKRIEPKMKKKVYDVNRFDNDVDPFYQCEYVGWF